MNNPYRAYWEKAQEQSLKLAQFYTPECLVELCLELLKPQGELFDPCCGLGSFLLKAKSKDETLSISGNDIATDLGELPFEFTHGDYLQAEDKQFDYIIANIPFNVKKTHCQLVDENYCWIEKIIKNTRKKALIILPSGVNSRENPKILAKRKQIVESGVLELVVQLPSHLFNQTGIAPCLWLINKDKVEKDIYFLNARRKKFVGERKKRQRQTLTWENIKAICNKDNWTFAPYEKIKGHYYCLTTGIYDSAFRDEPIKTEEEIKQEIKKLAKETKKIMGELIPLQGVVLDWLTKLENDGEIF